MAMIITTISPFLSNTLQSSTESSALFKCNYLMDLHSSTLIRSSCKLIHLRTRCCRCRSEQLLTMMLMMGTIELATRLLSVSMHCASCHHHRQHRTSHRKLFKCAFLLACHNNFTGCWTRKRNFKSMLQNLLLNSSNILHTTELQIALTILKSFVNLCSTFALIGKSYRFPSLTRSLTHSTLLWPCSRFLLIKEVRRRVTQHRIIVNILFPTHRVASPAFLSHRWLDANGGGGRTPVTTECCRTAPIK